MSKSEADFYKWYMKLGDGGSPKPEKRADGETPVPAFPAKLNAATSEDVVRLVGPDYSPEEIRGKHSRFK